MLSHNVDTCLYVYVYCIHTCEFHFQAEFWESEPVPRQLDVQLHDHHLHGVSPEILQPRKLIWFTLESTTRNWRFWHWTLPWNQVMKFQVSTVSTKTPSLPTLLPPPSWHSPHSPHPLWLPNSIVARAVSMALVAVPWSETLLRPKSFWTSWFLGSLSKTSLAGWSHRWKKVISDKVLFNPTECA